MSATPRSNVTADVGGFAKAEAALERGGHGGFEVLVGERAGEPGNRDLLDVAGHHADHLLCAQHADSTCATGSAPVVPRSGER